MDERDWQEIRELRKEFMGTSKGIALGNLIAEKQRLDKVRQIVNSEVDLNICNNFGDVRKVQAIKQIVNNYDGSMPSMIKQFSEIQKILEKE